VYEPVLGGKKPDYLVRAQGADCVIEVEELHKPDPLPTEGFDPTRAVGGALRRAHKQLRGCKHLPTGIVVFSDAFFRTVSVGTVDGSGVRTRISRRPRLRSSVHAAASVSFSQETGMSCWSSGACTPASLPHGSTNPLVV
jgi:hypothetical protein